MNDADEIRLVRVTAVRPVAIDVIAYELAPADGRSLPPFAPGAHIDVHVTEGQVRQYSLCGDGGKVGRYLIAVKKEVGGRGGSMAMHRHVERGSTLGIGGPRNHFPLEAALDTLFIAGGIGITPILSMARQVASRGGRWELHYCARSREHAAFYDELVSLGHGRVISHFSELPSLDVAGLLSELRPETQLYCCGPEGLMKAVQASTSHWPQAHVHFEWFAAAASCWPANEAFQVELASSGQLLDVPANCSILQVLRQHGIRPPSACETGVCGSCETAVLAGAPQHRDMLLTTDEKASNRSMMICVSRADSKRLRLGL